MPVDQTWSRLRHLGARREQLIVDMVSHVQQMRALLECVWPASLDTAKHPFRSRTWAAALSVICERGGGGGLVRTRRLGAARFEAAVRREILTRGGQKPSLRIVRRLFTALTDPAGVIATDQARWSESRSCCRTGRPPATNSPTPRHRWSPPRRAAADRVGHLDHRHLSGQCRGDLGRNRGSAPVATARALVKHAGLAPRQKLSGTFVGRTKLTGQGRPGLRLAAWRSVWGAQRANPVYAARYRNLTGHDTNKLTPTQAQTAIAAAILRHLHAVITTGQVWDPVVATHGTRHWQAPVAA